MGGKCIMCGRTMPSDPETFLLSRDGEFSVYCQTCGYEVRFGEEKEVAP